MRRIQLGILAAAGAALLLAGCKGGPAQPEEDVGTEANWAAVGGAADEASYSRLTEITPDNVDKLGLTWFMDLPDEVTLESTPDTAGSGRLSTAK